MNNSEIRESILNPTREPHSGVNTSNQNTWLHQKRKVDNPLWRVQQTENNQAKHATNRSQIKRLYQP